MFDTHVSMASSDIVTKRIHLGGLTPNITPAHIKDRFKSFGNVLDVEELGVDGLGGCPVHTSAWGVRVDLTGQPRRFTYFTIQTTSSQLKKCKSDSLGRRDGADAARPEHHVWVDVERVPVEAGGGQAKVRHPVSTPYCRLPADS